MLLKKSRVLVTGAGGFIGSHLVRALVEKGSKVSALVHYNSRNNWGRLEELPREIIKEVKVISGDIRDPFFVKKITEDSDAVFHLAAAIAIPFSYVAPEHYVETNIKGTLNVMEAARANKTHKVIHTSTSEVYGTAQYTPIDEKHPLVGQSPYSASKIAADKIAESYHRSFGLPVVTVRPFNTFGPGQSARAVIPTIISQMLTHGGEVKVGSVGPVRDFTYVKDTVEGFIKAAERAADGETLNLGTGRGVSVGELIKIISSIAGLKLKIITDKIRVRPSKSEVLVLISDASKARRATGWKPSYTLEDGLRETIDYVRANIRSYKPEVYNL
ncbi:MAG: NAD-dependent dehydratase [Elusimicrobia bacterium HGW-Elusimicrobia-1]|jgi:NAD dependent epimerase/dehydratase|nr:MAG: NAD-dependent dehydratase [Methanomicrobiales archaeon HGW-Methanomicrobiales-5]PKN01916.1 MAG: NAD-dependent dehydratase [Elusimicrobia bacterium HGW-Elusimicrobia-1]